MHLNYEGPDKERSIQSDNTGADARDLAPALDATRFTK
jgi:hypothetical protein